MKFSMIGQGKGDFLIQVSDHMGRYDCKSI
jgi:hypothetical protein